MRTTVTTIGAGPGGLTLARVLARPRNDRAVLDALAGRPLPALRYAERKVS